MIDWLLEGDPSIRWQVMRDLLDAPPSEWEEERAKVASQGVGKALIDLQDIAGTWGGGIYTPKWTSTTYTLLLLRDLGIDKTSQQANQGGNKILERGNWWADLENIDTCVLGMWLCLGCRFGDDREIMELMARQVLKDQMPDGGWNCRMRRVPKTHHSSFHTTFNVLDGVREALNHGIGPTDKLKEAEARAIELLLAHKMFRSDKTGKIINPAFTELHFPHRWHYDILRGLDYIRNTPFIKDPRLDEVFEVLISKRKPNGSWPAAKTYSGKVFFPIENGRDGSRWNTLRALRCLKASERSQ